MRRGSYPIVLLLVILTLGTYWPVRDFEFVSFDDETYVTENPQVRRGVAPEGIHWAFTTTTGSNWHPLTWLSHMLDIEWYGLHPGGHHLTSLFLHLANTLLLLAVLLRMTDSLGRSAVVAGLFAVHPLHVESVAWVAERKDVLSTACALLAVAAYLRYVARPKSLPYLVALALYAAGLMAKPMVVTIPFLLLLLDSWPLGRFLPRASSPRASRVAAAGIMLEKVPFLLLAAAASVITYRVQESAGAMRSLGQYPLGARVANVAGGYLAYLDKTLWPRDLAVFYPHPGDGLSFWGTAVGFVLLFGATILAVHQARRRPHLAVGWFWYLGTLVPVIGFVQVGWQAMADRYSYLPLVGVFLLVVWEVSALRLPPRLRGWVLPAAAGAVLALLVPLARRQVGFWRTSTALFSHALEVTRENFVARFGMGKALAAAGRYDEAAAQIAEYVRLRPDLENGFLLLGDIRARQGRSGEARAAYEQALRIDPRSADAHNNLGVLLLQTGNLEEGAAHLEASLRTRPWNTHALVNLGAVLRLQGRREEAIRRFEEALRLDPGLLVALKNLAAALLEERLFAQALARYEEIARLQPDSAEGRADLALAFLAAGRTPEALRAYEEALRLPADSPRVRAQLEAFRTAREAIR